MRTKSIVISGLAAVILAGLGWPAAPVQDVPARTTVIKNVRLFDGEMAVPAASVVIENGLVKAVAPSLEPPAGAEVIDGTGKTLLPGLIDAHVHVWGEDQLRQSLVFGVTCLVDMFTSVEFASGIKAGQAGPGPHPRAYFVSPMTLVTKPGGHGTQYGLKIPTLASAAEAPSFVDARIAEGSDFIKVIYDDGAAYGFELPTVSLEETAAVIRAAHGRGKKAVVHAGSLKKCVEVLEAGADGLAHLNFDDAFDEGFGRLAASKNAFVIPTLTVLQTMNGRPDAAGVAADARLLSFLKPGDSQLLKGAVRFKTASGAYTAAERALRQLREAGVPILAGTDTPNPGTAFGAALHGELALLVKAGMTPFEALRAATSLPAEAFGIAGRGRIRAGCPADLVLVEGDPTADITATRAVVAVWKDGVKVDRDAYGREAERERRAVEEQKSSAQPPGSEKGVISDFEGESIAARFGSGWVISTDSIMGGQSSADMILVEGGAAGSRKALQVKGTVAETGSIRWAGAMFLPGATAMAPANLTSFTGLRFWAKGSGKAFALMVFCQSAGFVPKLKGLDIGPDWKEFLIPFESLGINGHDIMGIFLGASNDPGEFRLNIDNVELIK